MASATDDLIFRKEFTRQESCRPRQSNAQTNFWPLDASIDITPPRVNRPTPPFSSLNSPPISAQSTPLLCPPAAVPSMWLSSALASPPAISC